MKLNADQLDNLLDAIGGLAHASAAQALAELLEQGEHKRWHAESLVSEARQGLFNELEKLELL